MPHAAVVAILLFAFAPTDPARQPLQAWQWSDDARLDARFDPVSLRERWDRPSRKGSRRGNRLDRRLAAYYDDPSSARPWREIKDELFGAGK